MKPTVSKILPLLFIIGISIGCVEELDVTSEVAEDYEALLVVEATITDRLSTQEILLSNVYPLDSLGPLPERNASVEMVSANGNNYEFQETEAGKNESRLQRKRRRRGVYLCE
jgi:hypothetical protein